MSLNLPYGIKPIVPLSNLDKDRYGPWNTLQEALTATAGTREQGLTIGLIENGSVKEYWFKDGILDENLIEKGSGSSNLQGGLGVTIDEENKINLGTPLNEYESTGWSWKLGSDEYNYALIELATTYIYNAFIKSYSETRFLSTAFTATTSGSQMITNLLTKGNISDGNDSRSIIESGASGLLEDVYTKSKIESKIFNIDPIITELLLIGNGITGIHSATLSSTYTGFKGLEYDKDFSENYSDRSLVDKAYVDILNTEIVELNRITSGNRKIIYVNYAATGLNNGTSWTNAYSRLYPAIIEAVVGDEVWIAGGTYNLSETEGDLLIINPGSQIYGGFVGNEYSIAERVFGLSETIISGNNNGTLSNRILRISKGNGTILDGVTIEEYLATDIYGGHALYINDCENVIISNVKIRKGRNSGSGQGSAISTQKANVKFENVEIDDCVTTGSASSLYCVDSDLFINNFTIKNCIAGVWSGIYLHAGTYRINNYLAENNTELGDSYYGSGIYIRSNTEPKKTKLTITNSKFKDCYNQFGIFHIGNYSNCDVLAANCIFENCRSPHAVFDIWPGPTGTVKIVNCTFNGNNSGLASYDINVEANTSGNVYIYNTISTGGPRSIGVEASITGDVQIQKCKLSSGIYKSTNPSIEDFITGSTTFDSNYIPIEKDCYRSGDINLYPFTDVDLTDYRSLPRIIGNEIDLGAVSMKSETLINEILISATYSELAALVTANDLIQGQKYLLTDYATKHVIPNSDPIEIHTGTTEPLILTAANDHEFYKEVISTTYPSDIIHYRFDDNNCEDGTRDAVNKKWLGGTARNGWITYRKSTTNLLSTGNDWRNYKIRRWKLDCATWVSAANYTKMDVAKGSDDNIYVAKITHSGLTTNPVSDAVNWQLAFDLSIQSDGGFLSYTPINTDFIVGGITPTNIIINNTTPGIDYQDYYTFCILTELTNSSGLLISDIYSTDGQGYFDFEIGKFDYEIFAKLNSPTLEANVFYLMPDGSNELISYSNYFGANITNNTFLLLGDFHSNKIGNNVYSNIINYEFHNNNIGSDFYLNNISYGFYFNNSIGGFYSNTIRENFNTNILNSAFYNNIIKHAFSGNNINSVFVSNVVAYAFQTNIINSGLIYNKIEDNFKNNIVSASIVYCTINQGFQYNTIEDMLQLVDFSFSTYVYETYRCNIFKNSVGTIRLSYYDASDVLTVVNPTD